MGNILLSSKIHLQQFTETAGLTTYQTSTMASINIYATQVNPLASLLCLHYHWN